MRIISGIYKGKMINAPLGIRPTQDMVRKAVFDILGDIEGLSFLELYAGSGGVGLEALSLGAKVVVFVEKDRNAAKSIEANLGLLGLKPYSEQAFVINKDVLNVVPDFIRLKKSFDLIFLDPPYHKKASTQTDLEVEATLSVESLLKKTLQTLGACDILSRHGLVIAQHYKRDTTPESLDKLNLVKRAHYGDTTLSIFSQKD